MEDEPIPLCTRCEITLAKPPSSLCSGCLADELADRDEHISDALDGEDDPDLEAEMNCGMGPDGQCGNAGSEYCDLECPYRD